MRHIMLMITGLSLMLAACDKGKGGGTAEPSAKPAAAKTIDYSKIDQQAQAAKTGDDFTNLLIECGKLEIEAAADGNGELAKDSTHREHCRWNPGRLRAELAIAESRPDLMSVHCLSASMAMDELVNDGIHADEARALGAKVNAACGM